MVSNYSILNSTELTIPGLTKNFSGITVNISGYLGIDSCTLAQMFPLLENGSCRETFWPTWEDKHMAIFKNTNKRSVDKIYIETWRESIDLLEKLWGFVFSLHLWLLEERYFREF